MCRQGGKHSGFCENVRLVRQQSNLVPGEFAGDFACRQIEAFSPGDALSDSLGKGRPILFFFRVRAFADERNLFDLPLLM